MGGLARVMRPGAGLSLLLSSTDRDRGAGVAPIQQATLHALAEAYGHHGLVVGEPRPASLADVAAAHSTWGKRLRAGAQRPAWLLRARFDPTGRRRDLPAAADSLAVGLPVHDNRSDRRGDGGRRLAFARDAAWQDRGQDQRLG
jgi:hypothetical protein